MIVPQSQSFADHLLPTLFSKTFFLVSVQLLVTWFTTLVIFRFFLEIDRKLVANPKSYEQMQSQTQPKWHWVFAKQSFNVILWTWMAAFFLLLFWGENQSLPISFSLFTLWSVITGVMLEYVLITIDQGFGQRMIALTATIIFACAAAGIYINADLGFLRIPLFVALTALVIFNTFRLFGAMKSVSQGAVSAFGICLFTLYLIFDFNSLAQQADAGENNWPEATRLSIKIYLDAINLLLHLLSRHHHS